MNNEISKTILELREQCTPKGAKLLDKLIDLLLEELKKTRIILKGGE